MRILQVTPYAMSRRGGVQSHVRDLTRWLRASGHDATIVSPRPDVESDDPPIRPIGRSVGVSLSGTRFEVTWVEGREIAATAAALDVGSIDVVHLHTPFVPLLPLRLWRAFRRPTVATFHATLPPGDHLLRMVLTPIARAMAARADAVVAASSTAAALPGLGRPDRATEILPPTIDLSPWRDAGRNAAPRDPAAPPQLLFLGRFEARKGLDTLIAAWPTIVARGAAAGSAPELVVAGGGELAPAVEALAARGPGRVTIVPTPDDATARRLVAEADLMVAPAPFGESFGLVLVEALAAGTPVVAAANPGYAGVMTGEGVDLLVPPGDADALAAKAGDLLADPARRAALRAWGLAHVARFDVAAVGPRLVAVYERALARAAQS